MATVILLLLLGILSHVVPGTCAPVSVCGRCIAGRTKTAARRTACARSRVYYASTCVCQCAWRVCRCKCVPAKRTASTGIQCRCARRVGSAVGPTAASRRRLSGRGRGRLAIGRPGVPGRSAAAMGTARAVPHRRPRNTHLGFFRKEGKRIRYARPNNTL